MREHGVYKKVKKSSVPEGTKIIQVRWIDINKGDETNPNIRCRLVAKDFNTEEKPELFAGTPPLEALRIICSEASTVGEKENVIMVNDVRRAFFYARALRSVWIELPAEDYSEEDQAEDNVGLLEMSLCGTRDAAQNWQHTVEEHLKSLGFRQGLASGSVFHHEVKQLSEL